MGNRMNSSYRRRFYTNDNDNRVFERNFEEFKKQCDERTVSKESKQYDANAPLLCGTITKNRNCPCGINRRRRSLIVVKF